MRPAFGAHQRFAAYTETNRHFSLALLTNPDRVTISFSHPGTISVSNQHPIPHIPGPLTNAM